MKRCLYVILCVVIVGLILFSAFSAGAVGVLRDPGNRGDFRFEAEVESGLELEKYEQGEFVYYEILDWYSTEDETEEVESTPDYVLVYAALNLVVPSAEEGDRFGDYIVITGSCYTPYSLGFHIYVPSENKTYTLRQAFDMNPELISSMLSACNGLGGYIRKAGDVNHDGKLDVKDATAIQKKVAGLITFIDDHYGICNTPGYISDFDYDGETNVKDATLIQKRVAGLC